jgi:3-keto-disaccharide hydrolase
MKQTNSCVITSGLAALFLLAPFTPSQQPVPQTGQPSATPPGPQATGRGGGFGRGGQPFDYSDNEGWMSLFDGQTLNGWDGDTRYWGVKDGSIYVEPTCEKPTGTIYLVWQGGELSDFMLKFESKGTANVNGGVQYRSYLTADNSVGLKYPGRGGGGMLAGAGAGRGPGGPGGRGGQGAQAGRGGAAGRGPGRGPACENPGTPPTAAERAKWDMAGPQFDFDAANRYSGQYYEQLSGRGIAASPGTIVLAEPGQRRILSTIADKATLDSWFKKDDYNQFLLVAKGNVSTMFMNGHLISVFIDNDPAYFRPNGKIGLEVEGTGAYYTRNIWFKRM